MYIRDSVRGKRDQGAWRKEYILRSICISDLASSKLPWNTGQFSCVDRRQWELGFFCSLPACSIPGSIFVDLLAAVCANGSQSSRLPGPCVRRRRGKAKEERRKEAESILRWPAMYSWTTREISKEQRENGRREWPRRVEGGTSREKQVVKWVPILVGAARCRAAEELAASQSGGGPLRLELAYFEQGPHGPG